MLSQLLDLDTELRHTSAYLTKLLNILTYQELIWKRAHNERTILLWRGKINPARLKIYIYLFIYVFT